MTTKTERDGVLVLDGDTQCALGVIRSLGSRDVPVTVGGHAPRTLGMLSRYSDGAYVHPDPRVDYDAFVRHLITHLDRSDYFAVFAVGDHTSLLLARNKERIERTGTVVAVEDWETFDRAYDKGTLFESIDPLDVPSPETYAPTSAREVETFARDIDYPAVIKPRSKSHLRNGSYTATLVTDENYVDTPEELLETYRRIAQRHDDLSGPPLVQEYVPGTTTTTVALADDGEVSAYFQEERLRTYPSSGGNSALLGAVREPTMLDYAERVLGRLGWTGPAMVEFMRTPDDEFYVIEVNGRYWGSLPFAIESGVDFPWLHYLQLRGRDPSPFVEYGEYQTDVVQRRLLYEDVKWLGEHVADRDLGAIVPFLCAFYRTRHTFVAADDPVPTIGALVQAARLGSRSLRRSLLRETRPLGRSTPSDAVGT